MGRTGALSKFTASVLKEQGLVQFEVLCREADRALIRSLARRLAEGGPDAAYLRATVGRAVAGGLPGKGGILAAIRRSPLVGANLDLRREKLAGRAASL